MLLYHYHLQQNQIKSIMSNTITSSPSSLINNGSSSHIMIIYKQIKNIDRPRLFFNFYKKYGILRVAPRSATLQPRASSSSSSSSTPSSSSPWKKWLLGVLLTVILPAAGHKGGLLLGLKGKIDEAVEKVEHVAEVVEEMAEEAERMVEEVEKKLPGDSKIKKTLESFDHLAKMAVVEAKKAEDIIHKVKDVEEEIGGVFLTAANDQDKKR